MTESKEPLWARKLFSQLVDGGITLFTHVPDAGNAALIRLAGQSNKTIVVDPNEPVQFEYTGQLGAAYNWREMAPQFMTPNYIDHPIVGHSTLGSDPRCRLPRSFCRPADLTQNPM